MQSVFEPVEVNLECLRDYKVFYSFLLNPWCGINDRMCSYLLTYLGKSCDTNVVNYWICLMYHQQPMSAVSSIRLFESH